MKKRLLSLLLALVMVLTLVPVMGAETVARVTGVKVLVNGVEQPVGKIHYDDDDKLSFVYYGENFNKLNSNYKYKVGSNGGQLMKSYYVTVDTSVTPHTATRTFSGSQLTSTTWTTVSYTNAGESETVTGYTLSYGTQPDTPVVPEVTAKITGVTVKVNNEVQPEGKIIVADSDNVTVIFSGEHFEKLTDDYKCAIGPYTTILVNTYGSFTIDTTASPHTATRTFTGAQVKSSNNNPITYTNPGAAEIVTGYVFVNEAVEPPVPVVAKITGIIVKVNDEEQPEGEVFYTDGDKVTVVFTGENFDKLNTDYKYKIGPASGSVSTYGFFTIDTSVTPHTASKTITATTLGERNQAAVTYTNDGENETTTAYTLTYQKKPTTYAVTIDEAITNGTVTADKTTAAEGDTVTLTVTPDEGYELDTLKAGDSDVTTMNAYGQYTFTMPASDVTVTATFKPSEQNQGIYKVKVYGWGGAPVFGEYEMRAFQPETYNNIYYAEVARSEFNNFTGYIGYDFVDSAGNRVNDGGLGMIREDNDFKHYLFYCNMISDGESANSIQVLMPEVMMTSVATEYLEVDGTVDFGEPVRLKKKGVWPEDAKITIEVVKPDGAGNTVMPLAEDGQGGYTFICDELVYKVADEAVFRIDYNLHSYLVDVKVEYKASIAPTTNGEVTVEPEYVEAGETFTVTATPDSGYVVDTITVTDKDGNEVEPNEDGTYTMYAGGVTVTATFKKAASGGDQGGGSDSSQLPSKPSYPTYWPVVDETTVGGAKAGDQFTVLCRKLNVRAGAGTQFEKIGSLHRGEVVKGKDLGNGWIEIEYEGRTAYISAQYVEMHSADCEKDVTVICRKLNVRTGAGTEHKKIGSVTRGEVLCVVSESNGWYEVLYQDGTAWICAKYAA